VNKRVLRGVEFKRVWLQSMRCVELVVVGLYRTGSKLKEERSVVEETRRVSSSVSKVTSTKDQAKTERFASNGSYSTPVVAPQASTKGYKQATSSQDSTRGRETNESLLKVRLISPSDSSILTR